MKKAYILLILLLFVFLSANVVFAWNLSQEADKYYVRTCNQPNLRGTAAFMCDLRNRINEIPQGQPGEAGPQGEAGPIGPTGPSLKVVDATDQFIGYLVELSTYNTKTVVRVFDPELNLILPYFLNSGEFHIGDSVISAPSNSLVYAVKDCNGDVYAKYMDNPYFVLVYGPPDNRSYYRADSYGGVIKSFYAKSISTTPGECINLEEVLPFAARVHTIDKPTAVGPLSIVEE